MASASPYEDRRLYPRVPVAMPAFLQVDGERHAVLLLDLSAGGAKLNCPATVPTGTAVVLDCGTLRRSAVVRWQTGGVLGLCFDSELGRPGSFRPDRTLGSARHAHESPRIDSVFSNPNGSFPPIAEATCSVPMARRIPFGRTHIGIPAVRFEYKHQ